MTPRSDRGRRWRLLVLIALPSLLPVAAHAPSALASRLRRIAPSVTAFSSDGVRYAAWQTQESGPIAVQDTSTGRRSMLAAPTGCHLQDEGEGGSFEPTAAAGRFLLECFPSQRAEVLDARTGDATPLPPGTSWYRLGARYVRGNDVNEHQVVLSLATGILRRVGEVESIDLDSQGAPGARSICPRLRGAVRREGFEGLGDFAYRHGLFVHRYGRHGQVQLERCRGRSTILTGQFVAHPYDTHAPRSFDLRGGLLSWDSGVVADTTTEPDSGTAAARSRLFTVSLTSARRRSWALPRVRVPLSTEPGAYSFGYSAHTSNTVFWIATRTLDGTESGPIVGTMSVYSAPL